MIAITGANGQLGQLVVKSLTGKINASEIVALVRNKAQAAELDALGVTIREADYDDVASYVKALEGVEKVLLISSNAIGRRTAQHNNVIEAAKSVGVKQLVYTSLLKADTSPMLLAEEHKETEKLLGESGLATTILRNGWYVENYTDNLAASLEYGVLTGAAKEGVISAATRQDYAEAAANVLTQTGHENKTYELAGDAGFSLEQLAEQASQVTGKPLAPRFIGQSDFAAFLTQVGLPEGFAAMLADSEYRITQGWLEDNSKTLSKLLGRPTTSLATVLKARFN
ncbi:SDR family oxidoreductase [Pseudoalteromonas xiamenensis]|uniref:SDR family oxidoreductase n=1 Tax=Pseudoalteromonas xiamenensis TaxID=882626 RepID=UPI0027E4472F|nr:SDR family oxidoreductase [Pseudoalteromonas xiamenensis]WMN60612.1 SDR family oxidoreductase [Pseudoalteromonas xiamenensis]